VNGYIFSLGVRYSLPPFGELQSQTLTGVRGARQVPEEAVVAISHLTLTRLNNVHGRIGDLCVFTISVGFEFV
jgi:hypothetical protein